MSLTDTELRVLRGAAEGKTSSEQAKELRRSFHTVKTHRKKILRKLGARSMAQAVALAYEQGIFRGKSSEEEPTGGQISAFKAKRDELARLRSADKHQVESEVLAAASLRLGRKIESIADHSRREASDTLDALERELQTARVDAAA